ncbi:hypothetical protein FQR65_LT17867 [Abscondita terminalis]|nr:hypothetical protein FQR65_LT17867 [Abscondita terminalis]
MIAERKKVYVSPVISVESIAMEVRESAAGSDEVKVPVDVNGNATGLQTTWMVKNQEIISGLVSPWSLSLDYWVPGRASRFLTNTLGEAPGGVGFFCN